MDALDTLISKVNHALNGSHDNELLRAAARHLGDLHKKLLTRSTVPGTILEDLRQDFKRLEESGLWDKPEEISQLLGQIEAVVQRYHPASRSSSETPTVDRFSVVRPASLPTPAFSLLQNKDPIFLPVELMDRLQHAYFVHGLTTEPSKFLPPGKSILSMMTQSGGRPERSEEVPTLQEKIEHIAHKAFWDEALEALSKSEPSSQLHRIKSLYQDLQIAVERLLPPQHPILFTLSSPPSPTLAPLRSALIHVREVVVALRERCAPVRDATLDAILKNLDDPPPAMPLAKLLVDTIRSILKLADVMKDDLAQFFLGAMTEKQLRGFVRDEARTEERKLVLELWPPEHVKKSWSEWLQGLTQPPIAAVPSFPKWLLRLLQALRSSDPVSITITGFRFIQNSSTDDATNALPPIFLFSRTSLLYLQNFLQALVIAAALRSLTRSSEPATAGTKKPATGADATERVWALLRAEVDEEEGSGSTKLINLADEVVRASGGADEARLRAAVARTLQPQDPVFRLLQERLIVGLAGRLGERWPQREHTVPGKMQAGSGGERAGKRPRLTIEGVVSDSIEPTQTDPPLVIKGFEEPILVTNVTEALTRLRTEVEWLESVWADIITGSDDQA